MSLDSNLHDAWAYDIYCIGQAQCALRLAHVPISLPLLPSVSLGSGKGCPLPGNSRSQALAGALADDPRNPFARSRRG